MLLGVILYVYVMQVNCNDRQYLKQVENFLINKDKFSFTAQTKDDMTKLRREVGHLFIYNTYICAYVQCVCRLGRSCTLQST